LTEEGRWLTGKDTFRVRIKGGKEDLLFRVDWWIASADLELPQLKIEEQGISIRQSLSPLDGWMDGGSCPKGEAGWKRPSGENPSLGLLIESYPNSSKSSSIHRHSMKEEKGRISEAKTSPSSSSSFSIS
jgi:hypothetical protein